MSQSISSLRQPSREALEALDRAASKVEATGRRVRRSGAGYTFCCPDHDDHHPSMTMFTGRYGRVVLWCFVCGHKLSSRGVRELGLTWADLGRSYEFPKQSRGGGRSRRQWIAEQVRVRLSEHYLNDCGSDEGRIWRLMSQKALWNILFRGGYGPSMFSAWYGSEHGLSEGGTKRAINSMLADGDICVRTTMMTHRKKHPLRTRVFDMKLGERLENGNPDLLSLYVRILKERWDQMILLGMKKYLQMGLWPHTRTCSQGSEVLPVPAMPLEGDLSPPKAPKNPKRKRRCSNRSNRFLGKEELKMLVGAERLLVLGFVDIARCIAKEYGFGDIRPPRMKFLAWKRAVTRKTVERNMSIQFLPSGVSQPSQIWDFLRTTASADEREQFERNYLFSLPFSLDDLLLDSFHFGEGRGSGWRRTEQLLGFSGAPT